MTRRSGRVLTGIDRVERAYARALAQDNVPCFGIARSKLGYILIGPDALWDVVQRLCGDDNGGGCDLQALLTPGLSRQRKIAESALRRVATARCRPRGLTRLLARHLPPDFSYVNVGHSNLSAAMLRAVPRATVMLHDLIPIEHPEFQRDGQVEAFRGMLVRVSEHADLVICNSDDTTKRVRAYFSELGANTPVSTVVLGVEDVVPDPDVLPFELPAIPYFVTVGTIEPRKNHAFLLDIWDKFGESAPPLFICGNRGWNNDAVFKRLDTLPDSGPVHEVNGLSDAGLAALVERASGVLMPSFAEGFGLPVVEAVRHNTPVLANDLPIYRELVGNIIIYADVADEYLWKKHIRALAETGSGTETRDRLDRLTWDAHFKNVLSLI